MRIEWRSTCAALLVLVASGCALESDIGKGLVTEDMAAVPPHVGMTQKEALGRYGKPLEETLSNTGTWWIYDIRIPTTRSFHQRYLRSKLLNESMEERYNHSTGSLHFKNGRVVDYSWPGKVVTGAARSAVEN